jgi:Xaa-Pro aminopeptidase
MNDLSNPVESALASAHLDALLVTRDANQRFLEGYTGSECYLLVAPSARWLIADSRYSEQAGQECRTATVVLHRDPFPPYAEVIANLVRDHGLHRLGFEKTVLSYGQYEAIAAELAKLEGRELIPTDGIVERLRLVKRPDELEKVSTACAIADRALEETLGTIREGMSELELARGLEQQLAKAGADGVAFATIAAFGARSSQPHAVPSADVRLQRGDFILLDFGALHHGYRSDTTRTFVLGQAAPRQREVYAAVLEAQRKGIAAIRPGVSGREPDAVAREHTRSLGFPEFGYGVGHGVGLEIHELPFLSKQCEQVLAAGMVVTVEPGIYVPDWGGVRIEDTVLVTEAGSQCLTHFPKDTLLEL